MSDAKENDAFVQRRRVWQATRFDKKPVLMTLNEPAQIINGTTFPVAVEKIEATPAYQYVLEANARMYDKQLEAMRIFEKKLGLVEIAPKDIEKKLGQIPKEAGPKPEATPEELSDQVKKLLADQAAKDKEIAALTAALADHDAKADAEKKGATKKAPDENAPDEKGDK